MSKERVYPCWRYHKEHQPIVIHNEAQHEKLKAEGWEQTPAAFLSTEEKPESPREKLERELAELAAEPTPESTPAPEVSGELAPEGGSDLSAKSVKQLKAILKDMGCPDDEVKGKGKEELIALIQG